MNTGLGKLNTDLYVAGRWRPGGSAARFEVVDPATESVLASVADATVTDGIAAIDAASAAGPGWASTPPRQRAEVLRRAYQLMMDHADFLARLITRENGKALPEAVGEVHYAAEFFRWYAEEAVRLTGEVTVAPSGANRILVQHHPIGVAVLVTPWNFPAAMATRKIAPALAAGCTTVLKPAAETPLAALAVAGLLEQAGVPAGVLNVVTTTRASEVVSAMLHDPRVRKLSFTGSTEVGRILLREAADQVLKCSMELGGNAPFVVLADADLDAAVGGAMIAKMRNGGQACTAANRFYIAREIFDDFARMLTKRMHDVRVGDGEEADVTCGPLVNAESVRKVVELVDDAVGRGARVLVGGGIPNGVGHFYQPTVLVDVPPEAQILREEIFGPVAVLVPFDDVDEVVARANDTDYGLVAYVYTRDMGVGLALAERLESGMVALNRGLVSDAAAPFGGVKQSGLGREGSHVGILEFIETKYIATDW
jgi:succinate-semialdehyde dehydrogenase / glutarate-semialdehyde dehydrogenase